MNPLARLLAFLAPYNCVQCNAEGKLLCSRCRLALPRPTPSSPHSIIDGALVRTEYAAPAAKQLLWKLKSDRAQQAAVEIAEMLVPLLEQVDEGAIITFAPTAPQRIRLRGYDQARLIARHLARLTNRPYAPLLLRQGNTRQVGAGRQKRQDQLRSAFSATNAHLFLERTVLIVDDVLTTGATLEAAAAALRAAGARRVIGVVFAAA